MDSRQHHPTSAFSGEDDIGRAGEPSLLTEQWAEFAAGLRHADLPSALIPVLQGVLLDTVGVALAASTLGSCGPEVAGLARAQSGGARDCSLLGHGDRVSYLMAGLANGTLAHALNFDAVGRTGGHIGLATVPAPLAAAELSGGVSGKDLLVSLALAAELTTRLATSIHDVGIDVHEKFLEGQILGVFGAAVGAGKARGFDARGMHNLLGLALMQACGTRQVSFEGGAGKAIAGGLANHAALLAVLLAEQGIDARCAALEGRAGLYGLFYGGRYRRSAMAEGLGEEFLSMGTVFKPWPTSGVLHPFIAASLDLRQRHRLDPSAIARVRVVAGEPSRAWLEPEKERRRPANGATAANSIFFGVAKALVNGDVTLADFSDDGLVEQRALSLAGSMAFEIDPALGRGAMIEVEERGGAILSAAASADLIRLSFDDLAAKFGSCARHAAHPLSSDRIDAFVERVWHLEKLSDIRDLLGLLHR